MNYLRTSLLCAVTWGSLLALGVLAQTGHAADDRMAVDSAESIADPFARLRGTGYSPRMDYWHNVGQALAQLKTIDGAVYDKRFGVITLHGKPSDGNGPYDLDDLIVALKAVYFADRPLGMTIDPDPRNLHGPEMIVRYFGGCQDTALGWTMFECDRLLKSLSHGKDSLTGKDLDPDVPEFMNMLELGLATGDRQQPRWNRFWLACDFEQGPSWYEQPTSSNKTQPVVYQTEDGAAISFLRCRVFLRTQVMELRDGEMVPSDSGADQAAERFAIHFSNHFEEFAEKYPEFARVSGLARLTVLAEWIEKSAIPLDVELLREYQQRVPVRTPTTTPASTVSLQAVKEVDGGLATQRVQSFGGVELKPRTFFANDVKGQAAALQQLARNELVRERSRITWTTQVNGNPTQVVVLPTRATQLKRPPASSGRPATSGRAARFRRPTSDVDAATDLLPRAEIAQDERSESAPVERVSLASIDRYRQMTRGPPESWSEVPVLHDDRYVAQSERGEKSPTEKVTLNAEASAADRPIRGPPGDQTKTSPGNAAGTPKFDAGSDRGEKVGRDPVPLVSDKAAKSNPSRGPPTFGAVDERAELVGRETVALASDSELDWGMRLFSTATQQPTFSMPKLVQHQNRHRMRRMSIEGVPDSSIDVPDQIGLTSEIGDIAIPFGDPEIDQARRAIYFPPQQDGAYELVGYYPLTRSLEFRDGMQIRFDEQGNPGNVQLPDGTSLQFRYPESAAATDWPRPESCLVAAAGNRAESGEYRLQRNSPPPVSRTQPSAAVSGTVKPNTDAEVAVAQDGEPQDSVSQDVVSREAPMPKGDTDAAAPQPSGSGTDVGAPTRVSSNSPILPVVLVGAMLLTAVVSGLLFIRMRS